MPQQTIKKRGFPHKFLGIRIGWSDLGKIGLTHDDNYQITKLHELCMTRVRIGKEEDGELFRYCPRCLVKVLTAK